MGIENPFPNNPLLGFDRKMDYCSKNTVEKLWIVLMKVVVKGVDGGQRLSD